jgi:probable rRNA maturation factor
MSIHAVEVQIHEQFQAQVQREPLRQAALATLIHQRVQEPSEVAVVVTNDTVLHELNRRHRGIDAPTDVLAFPDETRGPFVAAPGLPRYLGDVIISFHRAEAQAAEIGHSVEAELQLLVVHGVLHLLGYDDVTDEQRARMWAAQAQILRDLGVEAHPPG